MADYKAFAVLESGSSEIIQIIMKHHIVSLLRRTAKLIPPNSMPYRFVLFWLNKLPHTKHRIARLLNSGKQAIQSTKFIDQESLTPRAQKIREEIKRALESRNREN